MARPQLLEKPKPVQFFCEQAAHEKALANLKAMNKKNRTRLTLSDYLRASLEDLAEGRVSVTTAPLDPETDIRSAPPAAAD